MSLSSIRTAGFRLLAVLALAWCSLQAVGQNGSEEKTPPMSFQGPASADPKPSGLTFIQLRVAWAFLETGDMRLTVHGSGAPGASFLLGALRPGAHRPVVIAPANLDSTGQWTLVRDLSLEQARAIDSVEFVAITR